MVDVLDGGLELRPGRLPRVLFEDDQPGVHLNTTDEVPEIDGVVSDEDPVLVHAALEDDVVELAGPAHVPAWHGVVGGFGKPMGEDW